MTEESNSITRKEDIKPNIGYEEVKLILNATYGLKGDSFKQLPGYDDLNYHFLPKYSCNPFIKTLWPPGYVLKIMNSLDSMRDDLCEAQIAMMLFLRERNIPSSIPVKTMRGVYYQRGKFPVKPIGKETQKEHIIRLLEFQSGTVLKKIPKSYTLFYKLGIFLAEFNEALKEFCHSAYETHSSIWHLNSVPELNSMTAVVEIPRRRELVEIIIENFKQNVLTIVHTFEKGMIHGDFNEHNVLMAIRENKEWEVSAILDFGDAHYSCYIFELAVALCYMMFECKRHCLSPVVGAGHLLAGYMTVRPAIPLDCGVIKLCICARICQSLVLGLQAHSLHPENNYVLDSQEMGWPLLEELWEIPEEVLAEEWESVIKSYNIKRQKRNMTPEQQKRCQ